MPASRPTGTAPTQVPDQVPTWNCVAVHLREMLETLPEDALRPRVDALSFEHETRIAGKRPWTGAKMSAEAMPRMMRMILPFRFHSPRSRAP